MKSTLGFYNVADTFYSPLLCEWGNMTFSLMPWEKSHACAINARVNFAHFSQTTMGKSDSSAYMSGLFSWYLTMSLDFTHLLKYVVLKTGDWIVIQVLSVNPNVVNPRSRRAIILLLLLSGNVQSNPGPANTTVFMLSETWFRKSIRQKYWRKWLVFFVQIVNLRVVMLLYCVRKIQVLVAVLISVN